MMKKVICLLLSAMLLMCACPVLAEEAPAEEPLTFDVAAYFLSLCDLDLTPYQGKAIALVFFVIEMLVGDRKGKRHLFKRD